MRQYSPILTQVANTIDRKDKLIRFLRQALPSNLREPNDKQQPLTSLRTRDHFVEDVEEGMRAAPMSVWIKPELIFGAS
jgi:lysine 2,3-aminomutase